MAQVDEKTKSKHLCSIAIYMRFNEASELFCQYFQGFFILSPTSLNAAKCITAEGLYLEKICFSLNLSNKLTFSNIPNFIASDHPVQRESMVIGLYPLLYKDLHA